MDPPATSTDLLYALNGAHLVHHATPCVSSTHQDATATVARCPRPSSPWATGCKQCAGNGTGHGRWLGPWR